LPAAQVKHVVALLGTACVFAARQAHVLVFVERLHQLQPLQRGLPLLRRGARVGQHLLPLLQALLRLLLLRKLCGQRLIFQPFARGARGAFGVVLGCQGMHLKEATMPAHLEKPTAQTAAEAEREAKRLDFLRDTLESLEEYERTGLHVTGEEMSQWLRSIGSENELPPPVCHR